MHRDLGGVRVDTGGHVSRGPFPDSVGQKHHPYTLFNCSLFHHSFHINIFKYRAHANIPFIALTITQYLQQSAILCVRRGQLIESWDKSIELHTAI